MPIKPPCRRITLAALTSAAALTASAQAQTDDVTPFYAGGSLGVSHVSNVFRQANANNSDTVVSAGLLAGLDQRFGRQHVTVDGLLQNNRYSSNRDLDNQSYTLRSALAWQTLGNLSGTLSATSSRALADFNIGGGVTPIFKKNTERNDEYAALVRLGMLTRYSLEGGWSHKQRDFSAPEYDRFAFRQDTSQLGVYATPGGNLKLGLVGRHTQGQYPRYPVGVVFNPATLQFEVRSEVDHYTRNDVDFTTSWDTGGSSSLNTRLSRSQLKHSLDNLRNFSGTTGAIGWTWRPTGKIQLGAQYSRDTGQESTSQTTDVNRLYTSWRLTGSYALTGKLSLNANFNLNRSHRASDAGIQLADAFDNDKAYGLGLSWAFSRGLSLTCQYNHASRDSSVPQYIYGASSYGCTGQAIVY
ncbi:outer membrane beta-barrel protein [Roseateles sp.]|uniref:outer membrane beta-barrel protein n=1 Tax=Roseateles sp. TaxID=1971397 RepID=UPI00260065B9|nr:outer membrane beta-barrel protein [Roseateles sp.]MBV8033914.1 outer membrane beta-barrel protein [Roseateles sp.]